MMRGISKRPGIIARHCPNMIPMHNWIMVYGLYCLSAAIEMSEDDVFRFDAFVPKSIVGTGDAQAQNMDRPAYALTAARLSLTVAS